jgi:hypothetical protein
MDLSEAIESRAVVRFTYDGLERVVIPAALGNHVSTGTLLLRGYQTGGSSKSRPVPLWDLFTVAKITDLEFEGSNFTADPPGYSRGDKHLRIITEL